jgi:hypothetical protein
VTGDQVVRDDLQQLRVLLIPNTGSIAADGQTYISPTYQFTYIDNRFDWKPGITGLYSCLV